MFPRRYKSAYVTVPILWMVAYAIFVPVNLYISKSWIAALRNSAVDTTLWLPAAFFFFALAVKFWMYRARSVAFGKPTRAAIHAYREVNARRKNGKNVLAAPSYFLTLALIITLFDFYLSSLHLGFLSVPCFLTALDCALRLQILPTVLLLTTTGADGFDLHTAIKVAIAPLTVASLVDDSLPEADLELFSSADVFRTSESEQWQRSVQVLMAICPFTVFDLRTPTLHLDEEAGIAISGHLSGMPIILENAGPTADVRQKYPRIGQLRDRVHIEQRMAETELVSMLFAFTKSRLYGWSAERVLRELLD